MDHPLKAWDRAVPLLEDISFDVSYKGIVSNLILCEDHRPPGIPAWMSFADLLSSLPSLKSQNILDTMRDRIDHYLVGTIMSDSIRKKYVKRFHDNFSKCQYQQQSAIGNLVINDMAAESIVDVWPFLDCILDESFEELKTHTGFPNSEPNPKLISTINKHSPLLKKLILDCTPIMSDSKITNLRPFILSLSSLEHLKVLELFWSKENEHLSRRVLSLVGKSCPLLTRLKIVQISMITTRDIMAIALGELVDELLPEKEISKEPEWLKSDCLNHLEVPPQLITPICSSLQEMHLFWECDYEQDEDPMEFELEIPTILFILRNFKSLKRLEGDKIFTTEALITLYKLLEPIRSQSVFETACQEALNRMPSNPPISIAQRNYSLSLTMLNYVDVHSDNESLQAVGSLCPHLKRAKFLGYDSFQHNRVSNFSPKKMKILRKWPKLTSIEFHDLSWKKVRSVLKVFGPGLKLLKFMKDCNFVVLDLSLCPQLESLFISASCKLVNSEEGDSLQLNPATFLPQLSSFQSDICLGEWASLFEQKSSLVRLLLSCCHLGIETYHPEEQSKKKENMVPNPLKWSKIPQQMWPNMEVLRMIECPGLTLTMVPHLVGKLRKLKEIWLPHSLWPDEDMLTPYAVRDQLSSRHPPIDLKFYDHQLGHHYVHNE